MAVNLKDPAEGAGISTEMVTGAIVIGAVIALVLIKRGFRGVSVGGLSVGIK